MHSAAYEFSFKVKYVVHHYDDCSGEAIFTKVFGEESGAETRSTIGKII